jgi:hypothetical protein
MRINRVFNSVHNFPKGKKLVFLVQCLLQKKEFAVLSSLGDATTVWAEVLPKFKGVRKVRAEISRAAGTDYKGSVQSESLSPSKTQANVIAP